MVKIRDFVNYLISFLVILALFSVVKYVNVIYSAALVFVLLIFLLNEKFKFLKLNRKLLTAFAFLFSGLTLVNTNVNTLLLSLCHIIIIFICIKLLEEKGYRDYMQLIILTIFLTTASGLFSLSMIYLVYIVVSVFVANIAAIFITFVNFKGDIELESKSFKQLLFKGSGIVLFAVPLAAVIFIVLPRTDYPLFSSIGYSNISKSGFSSEIGLGDVNSIQEDNSIAFRAVMKKVNRPLYFRGVVFDVFEENRWKSSVSKRVSRPKRLQGERVEYEIYLEPHFENFLITLDYPLQVDAGKSGIFFTDKLEVKDKKLINKKIKYKGVSYLVDKFKDEIEVKFYTDVSNVTEKVLKFAESFKRENNIETANAIINYLKSNISYSLQDLPTGENSIEDFLFNVKKGNCEFFASSMAVLLRANNIPARLVGGFKGGYYNENGGYYAVANKNAHVWVEAYLEGYWVRFDPTPAAIEQFTNKNILPLSLKIRLYFDYISYYWTKFVINYDFQKQISLFKNVSSSFKKMNINVSKKVFIITAFAITIIVISFYFVSYKRKRQKTNYYLNKFYKILKNHGVEADQNLSLLQNIRKIENDDLRNKANLFVEEFYRMKYRNKHVNYKKLNMFLKEIKKFK
ncbi:DUF3488 and transglutaminase-like domain-containing protein [Deferribacterales bacterium Es71-Z0220]|uniref:transglutaminase family protein n=1 Tax=Deferrivibrio essentukiensis TaxID=2880922 RepID=UPI001F61291C|nr:DUF3488 and transglutaminase-like domain-containing protein [Deferrivibrio essentukiensis]MCB4204975.1 DUF3488 and transglutaminase-like domain-containing protein [Deferrivibrio essentukiensis]